MSTTFEIALGVNSDGEVVSTVHWPGVRGGPEAERDAARILRARGWCVAEPAGNEGARHAP